MVKISEYQMGKLASSAVGVPIEDHSKEIIAAGVQKLVGAAATYQGEQARVQATEGRMKLRLDLEELSNRVAKENLADPLAAPDAFRQQASKLLEDHAKTVPGGATTLFREYSEADIGQMAVGITQWAGNRDIQQTLASGKNAYALAGATAAGQMTTETFVKSLHGGKQLAREATAKIFTSDEQAMLEQDMQENTVSQWLNRMSASQPTELKKALSDPRILEVTTALQRVEAFENATKREEYFLDHDKWGVARGSVELAATVANQTGDDAKSLSELVQLQSYMLTNRKQTLSDGKTPRYTDQEISDIGIMIKDKQEAYEKDSFDSPAFQALTDKYQSYLVTKHPYQSGSKEEAEALMDFKSEALRVRAQKGVTGSSLAKFLDKLDKTQKVTREGKPVTVKGRVVAMEEAVRSKRGWFGLGKEQPYAVNYDSPVSVVIGELMREKSAVMEQMTPSQRRDYLDPILTDFLNTWATISDSDVEAWKKASPENRTAQIRGMLLGGVAKNGTTLFGLLQNYNDIPHPEGKNRREGEPEFLKRGDKYTVNGVPYEFIAATDGKIYHRLLDSKTITSGATN